MRIDPFALNNIDKIIRKVRDSIETKAMEIAQSEGRDVATSQDVERAWRDIKLLDGTR